MKKSSFLILILMSFASISHALPTIPRPNWQAPLFLGAYGMMAAFNAYTAQVHPFTSKAPLASDLVTHFVRSELTKFDIKNVEKIMVRVIHGSNMSIAVEGSDLVLLAPINADELHNNLMIISDKNSSSEVVAEAHLIINTYRALIAHEAAHIKNNDTSFRLPLAQISIASLGYMIHKALCKYISYYPSSSVEAPLRLYLVTSLLFCKYAQYVEQQADEAIPQNKELLTAISRYFKLLYNNKVNSLINLGVPPSIVPYLLFTLDPVHPPLVQRIERFEQRIKTIDKLETLKKNLRCNLQLQHNRS